MSEPHPLAPQILVMGTLHADPASFAAAMTECLARLGPIAETLGPLPWDYTGYYREEMGPELIRHFHVFDRPVPPEELPDIKLFTNRVESQTAVQGKRRVNLDPGLLTSHNLVLATGKPRHQRVYLGRGIFGDLTLVYHSGGYQKLDWTYPDWGSDEVRGFLARQRNGRRNTGKEGGR